MDVLPLVLFAFAAAAVALGFARGVAHLRQVDAPDTTLAEDAATTAHGELAERKEMLMQLIESTNLDFDTAKIGEEERDRTLRSLKREAVAVLKRMEELGGEAQDLARAEAALTHLHPEPVERVEGVEGEQTA